MKIYGMFNFCCRRKYFDDWVDDLRKSWVNNLGKSWVDDLGKTYETIKAKFHFKIFHL